MTTTITRQDCIALPYTASSKRKAEMFAAAIEVMIWPRIETEVFEDGGRWAVVIVEGMEHIGNPESNQDILSAFSLLQRFDLAESTGDLEVPGLTVEDFEDAQEALTCRARRHFRLEDKIDIILTALVGTEGAKALELPNGESRRLESATA